jgi:hypothetical protein
LFGTADAGDVSGLLNSGSVMSGLLNLSKLILGN